MNDHTRLLLLLVYFIIIIIIIVLLFILEKEVTRVSLLGVGWPKSVDVVLILSVNLYSVHVLQIL